MSGFRKLEMSGFRHPLGPGGRHEGRGNSDDEYVKGGAKLDHGGGVKLDHLAAGRSS